jgi:hypothetical protein
VRAADEHQGLRVLSRKSYEAHAVSVFDNPLSSRFDENDALIYFDDEGAVGGFVTGHRHVPRPVPTPGPPMELPARSGCR